MPADLSAVDALARLQLRARQLGYEISLCEVSGELAELLTLCGINDVLRIEVVRQPEERE